MSGAFKMKGSPMKRNFGIGSPLKEEKKKVKEEKKKVKTKMNRDGSITKTDVKTGKSSTYTPSKTETGKGTRYTNPKGGEFFVSNE